MCELLLVYCDFGILVVIGCNVFGLVFGLNEDVWVVKLVDLNFVEIDMCCLLIVGFL